MKVHRECLEEIAVLLEREAKQRTGTVAYAAELFALKLGVLAKDAPTTPKDVQSERRAIQKYLATAIAERVADLVLAGQDAGATVSQIRKLVPTLVYELIDDMADREAHRRGRGVPGE